MLLLMMMIMMFRRIMMIMIIVILTDSSSGTYSEALWCYERCLAIKILAAGSKIINTSYLPTYLLTYLPTYLPIQHIISYYLISYHLICSGETHQCLTSTYNSLGLIHKLHGERDDVLSVAVCRKSYLRCDCCCETTIGWMYR